jgi:hypothetical protein
LFFRNFLDNILDAFLWSHCLVPVSTHVVAPFCFPFWTLRVVRLLAFRAAKLLVFELRIQPVMTAQAFPQARQVSGSCEIQNHPQSHTVVEFKRSLAKSYFGWRIRENFPHYFPRLRSSDGPCPR